MPPKLSKLEAALNRNQHDQYEHKIRIENYSDNVENNLNLQKRLNKSRLHHTEMQIYCRYFLDANDECMVINSLENFDRALQKQTLSNVTNKPVYILYRTDYGQWAALTIINDAGVKVLYRSHQGEEIESGLKSIIQANVARSQNVVFYSNSISVVSNEDVGNGSLISLKNLGIMKEELFKNKESFVARFTEYSNFCQNSQDVRGILTQEINNCIKSNIHKLSTNKDFKIELRGFFDTYIPSAEEYDSFDSYIKVLKAECSKKGEDATMQANTAESLDAMPFDIAKIEKHRMRMIETLEKHPRKFDIKSGFAVEQKFPNEMKMLKKILALSTVDDKNVGCFESLGVDPIKLRFCIKRSNENKSEQDAVEPMVPKSISEIVAKDPIPIAEEKGIKTIEELLGEINIGGDNYD